MQHTRARLFKVLAIALCVASEAFAQPSSKKHEPVKLIFYYDAVWELTTPENSLYRREAYFDLTDMVFDGVFSDYNRKDELIADGFYNHGIKSGIHTEYANHSVRTKVEYAGETFTFWEWNDGKNAGVQNGNGKFTTPIFYFVIVDGQVVPKHGTLTGEFRNGRRTGKWTYNDSKGLKEDEELYSNGQLVKRIQYVENESVEVKEGKAVYLSLNSLNTESLAYDKVSFANLNQYFRQYVTYPSTLSRNATYPGGIRLLLKRMANEMTVPERNIEVIELRINESGEVIRTKIVRSINRTYDDLTERLFLLHRKKFLPAIYNGKPVMSVIYLPIASGDEWMKTLEEAPLSYLLDVSNFAD